MRWLFRRRRGRHCLGAAVTGLPSAPTAVLRTQPPVVLLSPATPATPASAAPPVPPAPPVPRVSLGFRDGSGLDLDPLSSQALALQALAAQLSAAD